jgi:hypothetical protein
VYREREKEREKEKKQRENNVFFIFCKQKRTPAKKYKNKIKKYSGTRVQGSGALVPWYQGSHLRNEDL